MVSFFTFLPLKFILVSFMLLKVRFTAFKTYIFYLSTWLVSPGVASANTVVANIEETNKQKKHFQELSFKCFDEIDSI